MTSEKKNLFIKLGILTVVAGSLIYFFCREQYIINPDLPIYKKYEWATWQDSAGGRLAHDPAWFKMPAEKYIPEEKKFVNHLPYYFSAKLKRDAYFAHLCKTESVGYRTPEFPEDSIRSTYSALSTWFYPRIAEDPVKNMKSIVGNNPMVLGEILNVARQNPYINPGYGFKDWNSKWTLDFFFKNVNEEYYNNPFKYHKLDGDTFREYMMNDGTIYRITYDAESGKYQPLEKIELKDIQAQYYTLKREIERPEMKKLGIYGSEVISFDRKNNKLIQYGKTFRIPLYMDSMRGSGQHTPIDWKREHNCTVEHQTVVNALEN